MHTCIDLTKLNCVIIRPVHRGQTVSDVLSKLSGATYFSHLDATSGIWNCALNEESSKLTTFATPYGRYRFKRLPFGLSCAGDLFQAKIDETFEDMQDFAQGIVDDILVVGFKADGSDHDAALDAVCKQSNDMNLCLNERNAFLDYNCSFRW